MTPMWSSDAGNLCLALYFMSVFSTCSTEQCELPKVDNSPPCSVTIRNIGIKLCQVRCHEKGGCLSFEYNYETLTCRLSSDEAENIMKREGYIVQFKDHSYVQTGPCASKTCSLNSRCLVTRSGKAVCVDATSGEEETGKSGTPQGPDTRATSGEEDTGKFGTPLGPDTRAFLTPRCSATKIDSDLSKASKEGNLPAVAGILEAGWADVNCRAGGGKTPVMLAAYGGHREVVELLMSKGADVSLVDSVGNNLLHNACLGGDMKTVKFVLALNVVDIDARNRWLQRAEDLATFWGYPLIVDLLMSHGT